MDQLRALVDAYAVAADERDAAALADLFAEDAWLEARGHRFEGRAEIASIPSRLERYDATLHLVSTHRATLGDDGRAEGVAYCEAHHRSAGVDAVQFIRYLDTYGAEGDRWRFTSRVVEVLWEERR